ncbi:MAG: acyl carrier protein [Spirochaetaceae bacterium]|nr:acyl carrier protein [Spirochaetaceae bacterium]
MSPNKSSIKKAAINREEIKSIISRISRIPIDELDDDVRIREDLGVDSIMAMEIIATFEVKLGFTFDVDKYSSIDEVGEFIEIIQQVGSDG